MAPSSRRLVRSAVGLAAVAPALGLIVLAVSLAMGGGLGGVLAGVVVGGIALFLLLAALAMTHAPVSIKALLDRTAGDQGRKDARAGTNGQGSGTVEGDLEDVDRRS